MRDVLGNLYDMSSEPIQKKIINATVSIVNEHLAQYGIELNVKEMTKDVEPEKVKPKKKPKPRVGWSVHGKGFKSWAEVCRHYNVNPITAKNKRERGFPLEEIFIANEPKVLRRVVEEN